MEKWKWFVYIIECKDGLYYTGMTYDIDRRLEQHNAGLGSKFTAKHGFKELKYCEKFDNITDARQREMQLKDFSRMKKEALWNYSSNDSEKSDKD
jgi:putative endonuclease